LTHAHFFLIPTIFFLGFFLGGFLSQRNRQDKVSGQVVTSVDDPVAISSRSNAARLLGLSFVIFLGVFVATHMFAFFAGSKALGVALNGAPIFDKLPSFSSAEVLARLHGMGDAGREMYQQFTYTADLLFPLSLLAFLFCLCRFVGERTSLKKPIRAMLMALPFIWFSSDMLENIIVFTLIEQFPAENALLGGILGFVTVTKFALLLLTIVAASLSSVLYRQKESPSLNTVLSPER
jgi:hypothetical protein